MRKNYLTKSISISIILMLLAMMFSCQPLTESIDSGNSNGNNTNQGGNTGDGGGAITITLIGTDGNEYNKFDIKIGDEIELPANVEKFLCWNTKADGKGESYTGKSKFNKDMILYLIVLAENAYTITYELNGGVNDKTNPLSFTADEKITLKNPSKDGYRFSGWYETKDFSGTRITGWKAGEKSANVTLYAKWRDVNDKELTLGGTGVYNYTINIDALNNSGNSKNYPSFSIFLMTDGQIESMKSDGNKNVGKSEILEATKTKPVYQICTYGEMRTDTTKTGDYAVWGNTPVNGKLEYYEGISASIKGTALSITVDMTKLANAELKSYLDGEETFMTDDDTVSLSNYKPYISMNLDYDYDDYNSYIVCLDFDDMYKRLYGMNSGASFPTNPEKDAPAVPTYRDLTYFVTNISQLPVELKNNAFTFVAPVGVETNQVMFYFMNYNSYDSYPVFPIQIGGEKIACLNKNFPLDDLFNTKQPFYINSGVLTAGNMYTITLDVRGNNEAYAKVSEVKPTSIKINSTNHKTSYYVGDDINVANLTVEATTSDGTKVTVNVTADMISGFDSSKLGKQTLTITMDGCTTTYSVEVSTTNVTELSVTASEVVETIKGLTAGEYYKIKVSGTLDSNTMRDIQDALEVSYNATDYPKIALDLSNTTGLTHCSYSFYNCKGLTSIVFPEGMTSIPSFSSCDSLTSITIPASVENVNSINNCKKFTTFEVAENNKYLSTSEDGKILYNKDKTTLKAYPSATGAVTIPSGVTSIGSRAFYYCSGLTSVTIPDSVTTIGSDAFYENEKLTSVTIPDSVTTIGSSAFSYSGITSVTIGAGVATIESSAFRNCSNLTNIKVSTNNQKYSSDGKMLLSKDKTTLVAYPSATGDVTIPNGVTTIGSYAFEDCSGLTSVTIPDSVTTIGYEAFYDCENLESVTLGKNVKTIGSYAFRYCYKLASIEIPDSVTKIGNSAFEYCKQLTTITIPDSVTKIDSYAFYGCDSLTSVTFKDTDGWCYSSYDTGNVDINVTDAAQNATYLTDTYYSYTWKKVKSGMYISGLNSKWASDTDPGEAYVMTKGANDVWTFTFTAENTQAFPYGFKFTTEKGWQEQYQAYNKNNHTTDITILTPDQEAGVYFITEEEISASYENNEDYIYEDDIYDDATKFNVGALSSFIVGNKYTITFDKANMTVKISGEFKTLSYNDLKYIYGSLTDYEYVELVDNSYTFVADDYSYSNSFRFYLTEYGDFCVGGAYIQSLGTMYPLNESGNSCSFYSGVLTPGNEYTITLKVLGEYEAYVQVTEK